MDYPSSCRDCEDFETCPYPDLMTLLKDLAKNKFDGDVSILFEHGLPQRVSKQQVLEFVRE